MLCHCYSAAPSTSWQWIHPLNEATSNQCHRLIGKGGWKIPLMYLHLEMLLAASCNCYLSFFPHHQSTIARLTPCKPNCPEPVGIGCYPQETLVQ